MSNTTADGHGSESEPQLSQDTPEVGRRPVLAAIAINACRVVLPTWATDIALGTANGLTMPNWVTTIGREQAPTTTPRLDLFIPGIGRNDCFDIVAALGPSIDTDETTVDSLVYPWWGLDAHQTAEAILATGCKDITLWGHSIGSSHAFETLKILAPHIKSGAINKPKVVLLSPPSSGKDVISPFAEPLAPLPLGLTFKSILDLITYGEVQGDVAVLLEEKQLDLAVGFDIERLLKELGSISELVEAVTYIGDAYPDGVINTPNAGRRYQRLLAPALGDRFKLIEAPGLGHPDPAKDFTQAATYKRIIADLQNENRI